MSLSYQAMVGMKPSRSHKVCLKMTVIHWLIGIYLRINVLAFCPWFQSWRKKSKIVKQSLQWTVAEVFSFTDPTTNFYFNSKFKKNFPLFHNFDFYIILPFIITNLLSSFSSFLLFFRSICSSLSIFLIFILFPSYLAEKRAKVKRNFNLLNKGMDIWLSNSPFLCSFIFFMISFFHRYQDAEKVNN
jgi:hypothetical protein